MHIAWHVFKMLEMFGTNVKLMFSWKLACKINELLAFVVSQSANDLIKVFLVTLVGHFANTSTRLHRHALSFCRAQHEMFFVVVALLLMVCGARMREGQNNNSVSLVFVKIAIYRHIKIHNILPAVKMCVSYRTHYM